MRRFSAALFGLLLITAPALAQTTGPQLAAQAMEGATALHQQAAEAAAAGKRMDVKTAAARDSLKRALDTKSLAALPAPSGADIPWMLELLQASSAVNKTLFFFGVDTRQVNLASPPQALQDNVKQYEDELTSAFAYQIRLFPRLTAAADAFMTTLPAAERSSKVRQDGLAKMRRGAVESIQGALGFAADPGTKGENVRSITTAVAETANVWIKFTTGEDRERFAMFVSAIRSKPLDGKSDSNLAAISSALN